MALRQVNDAAEELLVDAAEDLHGNRAEVVGGALVELPHDPLDDLVVDLERGRDRVAREVEKPRVVALVRLPIEGDEARVDVASV